MSLSCKDFENIKKAVGKCKQLGFIRWEIWTDTEWKLEGQIKKLDLSKVIKLKYMIFCLALTIFLMKVSIELIA